MQGDQPGQAVQERGVPRMWDFSTNTRGAAGGQGRGGGVTPHIGHMGGVRLHIAIYILLLLFPPTRWEYRGVEIWKLRDEKGGGRGSREAGALREGPSTPSEPQMFSSWPWGSASSPGRK